MLPTVESVEARKLKALESALSYRDDVACTLIHGGQLRLAGGSEDFPSPPAGYLPK